MKKSVMALVLVTLLCLPVIAQVLDLPDPPPVPASESDQLVTNSTSPVAVVNTSSSNVDSIESRLRNLERLLALEDRLLTVESQTSQIPAIVARIDALEQQIAALQGEVSVLQNQPAPEVQSPSYEGLAALRDSSVSWFKWSLSVGVLALLGVMGIVGTTVYQRLNLSESTKRQLKSYLESYINQGYAIESLRDHLKESGWDPKLIDAVAKEIKDVPNKLEGSV